MWLEHGIWGGESERRSVSGRSQNTWWWRLLYFIPWNLQYFSFFKHTMLFQLLFLPVICSSYLENSAHPTRPGSNDSVKPCLIPPSSILFSAPLQLPHYQVHSNSTGQISSSLHPAQYLPLDREPPEDTVYSLSDSHPLAQTPKKYLKNECCYQSGLSDCVWQKWNLHLYDSLCHSTHNSIYLHT